MLNWMYFPYELKSVSNSYISLKYMLQPSISYVTSLGFDNIIVMENSDHIPIDSMLNFSIGEN